MQVRLTKETPSGFITEKLGSHTMTGNMRIYPPMEGDCVIVENYDLPGGGIVTSRVEDCIAHMDGRGYTIYTMNSIYKIRELYEKS